MLRISLVAGMALLLFSCGKIPLLKKGPSLGPSLHFRVSVFPVLNQNNPG